MEDIWNGMTPSWVFDRKAETTAEDIKSMTHPRQLPANLDFIKKGIQMNDQISNQMAEAQQELQAPERKPEEKRPEDKITDVFFQTQEDGVQVNPDQAQ